MPKDPVLDRIILQLSKTDAIRFRDIIEGGCFITGGLGSGKSSTIAKDLAMSFLYAGMGGLVLTVKSDETANWIEYARRAGRTHDLKIFSATSSLSFDFLAYLWQAGGRAAAQIETIVEIFTTLMSVGKPYSQSSGERYFENAVEELMRAVLVVLANAGEAISITTIHKFISSLPSDREQINSSEWELGSYCGWVIARLKQRRDVFTQGQWDDLDIAIAYLLEKWPQLDSRTSSNIESTWSSLASKFTYSPFREMFCSGRFDITPSQVTHERMILIVDVPVLEFSRETARICQILMKINFQRAMLRHPYKPGCCHGAFIFQDEFAFLLSRLDPHFHMVCRGSAVAPICITQNICSIAAEEFGEQTPGSKTLGFLGLFGTKVFMANNEMLTNEFGSNQIGREWQFIEGWNAGEGQHSNGHLGVSGSKQLVHLIEPIEFTRLMKPDGDNPLAEGIVHMNGRSFNVTKTSTRPQGQPYLRVHFSR
jgi:hypothetical protein